METKKWHPGRWRVMLFGAVFVMTLFLAATFRVQAASVSKGIDVSVYNNTVDWNSVKRQGYSFAMIRTGYGTTIVDSQFSRNYQKAGEAGIKRGAYHFACARTVDQAKQEARYCLSILNGRKLEYPLAYDIEYNSILSTGKANVTAIAKAFCDIVKKAGYVPMVYSSFSFFKQSFDLNKLKGVRLWVAAWNTTKPSLSRSIDIWQFSSSGSVPGANVSEGCCDRDYSYIDASKVKLNVKKKTLNVKEKFKIKAKVTPSNTLDKVKYTSSNPKVAKVSAKGIVTAKRAGKATITVKAGNVKAKCKVVVKKPKPVKPEPEEPDVEEPEPGEPDIGEPDSGVTDPGETDPEVTDPGETDPEVTDPGETDPEVIDLGETDPEVTDSGVTDLDEEVTDMESPAV